MSSDSVSRILVIVDGVSLEFVHKLEVCLFLDDLLLSLLHQVTWLCLILYHPLLDSDTCVSQLALIGVWPVVGTQWIL